MEAGGLDSVLMTRARRRSVNRPLKKRKLSVEQKLSLESFSLRLCHFLNEARLIVAVLEQRHFEQLLQRTLPSRGVAQARRFVRLPLDWWLFVSQSSQSSSLSSIILKVGRQTIIDLGEKAISPMERQKRP